VVDVIDAFGGVEIDITQAEMEQINANIRLSGGMFYRLGYPEPEMLAQYGENTHLDGYQALGYARIRKIDSDYERTNRQRKLISALLGRVKSHPFAAARAMYTLCGKIDTNLSWPALISLGEK